MEEEIVIVIVKKPQNGQTLAAEGADSGIGAHQFVGRAAAIAFLAGTEATDERA